MAFEQQIELFTKACHRLGKYDLLKCSSGNMSYRLDQNTFAVSATKAWLTELKENQVALCSLKDGRSLNNKKPTIESAFHRGILNQRKEINVVLHYQSPYATAIAADDPKNFDFNVIIEIPAYIGTPAVLEYFPPGSKKLANAVIKAMKNHDLAIMRNHGQTVVGKDFDDAIQKAVFFELACRILLTAKDTKPLSPKDVKQLRNLCAG